MGNTLSKLTIGIRPVHQIFRVSSFGGLLIDELVRINEGSNIHFDKIQAGEKDHSITLFSEDKSRTLTINRDYISYVQDHYELGTPISADKFITEFGELWNKIDEKLKIRSVRMVGIVGETRISAEHPSRELLSKLSQFSMDGFVDGFTMRIEKRKPTVEKICPDVHKDDFENMIYTIYDGARDSTAPKEKTINFNMDSQRYYTPPLTRVTMAELKKLLKTFKTGKNDFEKKMKALELLDD